jgi:hypothetical protein
MSGFSEHLADANGLILNLPVALAIHIYLLLSTLLLMVRVRRVILLQDAARNSTICQRAVSQTNQFVLEYYSSAQCSAV